MRVFSRALCTMVAVGLLTACSGGSALSPGSTIPVANRIKPGQTMSLPCHCHVVNPAGKKSRRTHRVYRSG
jgi:hypothetical protein